MHCAAFIATSLDGCIARADGALDWLPQGDPDAAEDGHGYSAFIADRDVLVMGRGTYDTVRSFDVGWPYQLPVVVLTNRPLGDAPDSADVTTASGPFDEVLAGLARQGRTRVYVDGGAVIQQCLAADLLDELTITVVPVVIGDGIRLFGEVPADRRFVAGAPRLVAGGLVQTTWTRAR